MGLFKFDSRVLFELGFSEVGEIWSWVLLFFGEELVIEELELFLASAAALLRLRALDMSLSKAEGGFDGDDIARTLKFTEKLKDIEEEELDLKLSGRRMRMEEESLNIPKIRSSFGNGGWRGKKWREHAIEPQECSVLHGRFTKW